MITDIHCNSSLIKQSRTFELCLDVETKEVMVLVYVNSEDGFFDDWYIHRIKFLTKLDKIKELEIRCWILHSQEKWMVEK